MALGRFGPEIDPQVLGHVTGVVGVHGGEEFDEPGTVFREQGGFFHVQDVPDQGPWVPGRGRPGVCPGRSRVVALRAVPTAPQIQRDAAADERQRAHGGQARHGRPGHGQTLGGGLAVGAGAGEFLCRPVESDPVLAGG